jgi:predicted O-linked N-acetylglucosamine transferase (SPINDLY family)
MSVQAAFEGAVRRHRAGDLAGAEQEYLRVVGLDPDHADAWSNLGSVRAALGRVEEALGCYQRAVQLHPKHAAALFNLGNAYLRLGRPAEALTWFEAARPLNPPTDQFFAQTGRALAGLGRFAEAAGAFRNHLHARPDDARTWHQLGLALMRLRRDADALAALQKAVEFAPHSPEARVTLGTALEGANRPDDALACYREALRLKPDLPEALNNIGNSYVEAGLTAEAIGYLRGAVAGRPEWAALLSNLLLALNYRPEVSAADLRLEHLAWAARHADPTTASSSPPVPDRRPGRKLRVGYISADFRRHPVAAYIGPVLAAHDHEAFHVTCYSSSGRPDEVTERLRRSADEWRDIANVADADAAELIRGDGIDILIDLGGHTAGNRLQVLARRPAPVQMTHFGYPNTTGMRAVDYRLTDLVADPPGTDALYTETLVRLPGVAWCWGPPENAPDPGPPPCTRNGFVTFGSLNNPAKMTEEVVGVWAKILHAVAGSKLLLLTGRLTEARRRFEELFARLGVGPERLRLEPRQSAERYYSLWAEADVGLDPFPYNGGVTTPDALWMGVPVVALAGASYRARQGLRVLGTVELGDWVADTTDAYVELAVRKAADLAGLTELRAGLRDRLRSSPLLDTATFTRQLEDAYRRMWEEAGFAADERR